MMLSVNRFSITAPAVLLAALALVMPARQARAQSSVYTEVEPNNTMETANPLPVRNLTFTGRTDRQGDVDWFQTSLSEGTVVRVTLQGLTLNFNGRIQVLNASGVVVLEAFRQQSESTLTASVAITAMTPPGTAFIRVSNDNVDGIPSPGFPYTVTLTQGAGEEEPNDSPAQAQILDEDLPIAASWPYPSNITDDYYRFETISPNETVSLVLNYSFQLSLFLRLELQDDTGEVLYYSDRTSISGSGTPKNPSLVVQVAEPGTYFVRIYNVGGVPPSQGQTAANYALFFARRSGFYETEPNQSFVEALPVTLPPVNESITVGGFLQSGQDVDVYRVVLPAGSQLVANVDVTSPFPVMDGVASTFLQEDLGIAFASNDNNSYTPDGATFALVNTDPYVRVLPLRGGEMFVAVADRLNRGGAEGFEYSLTLRAQSAPASESEPNDTAGSARRIASGEVVRGTSGATGDVDLFLLEGHQGETLLVNINAYGIGSFLDARVVVRDPDGQVLADRSDSAFSLDPFILLPELAVDGDYTIQVTQRPGQSGSGISFYYELICSLTASVNQIIADPDVDGSGRVDGFDLAVMSRAFGLNDQDVDWVPSADIVADGVIDGMDLAALGNFFGNEVSFGGMGSIVADAVGDELPFYGPSADPPDLVGIGATTGGATVQFSAFFREPIVASTGGILSVDSDSSGLTGGPGTPDIYSGAKSLGSDLEVFFGPDGYNAFRIPDPRGDIYPAFVAIYGTGTCTSTSSNKGSCASDADCPLAANPAFTVPCILNASSFPNALSSRPPLRTELVASDSTNVLGTQLEFDLDVDLLGGGVDAKTAALAVDLGEIEPTDRLPDQGAISLAPPFEVGSITVTQLVCDDDRRRLCLTDDDCVDAGLAGPCVDVDSLPPDSVGGAPLVTSSIGTREMVYLRTESGGPRHVIFERSVDTPGIDGGQSGSRGQSNDTLDRVFPLGTRGLSGVLDTRFEWFTRDLLPNFGARLGSFDPHTAALPPPDQDLYYLLGGEGDRAILEVETADDGQTFDSALELYLLPLAISALDPSSTEQSKSVAQSALEFIARNDNKDGADLDPRLEVTLPRTGLYLVRLAASACPAQTVDPADCSSAPGPFPGTEVDYVLRHETLAPAEVSIPVVVRGTFKGTGSPVAGLQVTLDFDPAVVRMTGFDLAQGMRDLEAPQGDTNPATAQEIVAERVSPGRIKLAIRSYRDSTFLAVNALSGNGFGGNCGTNAGNCPEIPVARLRFRAVGAGTTVIRFADNPTMNGEPLLNLGLGTQETGPVWQPRFGYGPGVQITVTGANP